MNLQPDNLFRDKLQHHQVVPPSSAWSRIDRNLRPSQRMAYGRVAAAVVLLLIGTWYVVKWSAPAHRVVTPVTHTNPEFEETVPQQTLPESARSSQPAGETFVMPAKPVHELQPANRKNAVRYGFVVPQAEQPVEVVTAENQPAEQQLTVQATGKTLYISLQEAQHFKITNITAIHATRELKKPSRIQKFVELASVITMDDDLMGRLRERKDELLVRNIRTVNEQHN